MEKIVRMVIHFMDGTKIVFKYPKLNDTEAFMIATKVKKALNQDKIVVQTYDSVIVIPVANIKFIQVSPPPDALPEGILQNAEIVEYQTRTITGQDG
ncbi:MAG: hypothetical protein ABIK15_08235 [Pseudomonadota bacterium]